MNSLNFRILFVNLRIRQVERTKVRQQGIDRILELLNKDHLIASIRYYLLNGWLGLVNSTFNTWYEYSLARYTVIAMNRKDYINRFTVDKNYTSLMMASCHTARSRDL